MERDLSPLEVAKQLKEFIYEFDLGGVDKIFVKGSFDIIEKELKKLENYEKNEDFSKDVLNYAFLPEAEKIDKIKAFDIVKEKGLDIREFRYCFSLYEYNICKNIGCRDLTQEEFDLLKRVIK